MMILPVRVQFQLLQLLLFILLNLTYINCDRTVWHAYDLKKEYPSMCYDNMTNELLPKYQRSYWQNKVMSQETMEKHKLWPDVISKFDFMHGETMYGLEEALDVIYKHQHPVDCKNAKFLISGMFESGFGSEMHVIGVGLATAMNLNRVYIMYPERKYESGNRWQVDIPFCHKQGKDKLNLECYYEPWSNCTIQDALGDKSVYHLRVENGGYLHPDGGTRQVYDKKYIDEKVLLVELNSGFDWDYPVVLDTLRQCSPFPHSKLKYWWRAVSVTYLMRLNDATRKLIHHFKYNETSSMYFDKENEQCVSVYARRGDKHLEMYIMKNETVFFETAKHLWETQMTPRLNSNQERPIMFVASEDGSVIDSAIEWGKVNNWKIIYTDLFDRKQVIAGLSVPDRIEWVKTHPVRNHHLEYFSMILNIDSHIQCDAYVCSMPSNFCRLIDELKATVGAKTNTILADFHDGSEKPCYTGNCITVGW